MLWSRNLQLLYPFQNTALDYSGNARNGTVNGSGVYATKPNGGRCLYFDGTGDYVTTPSFTMSGAVLVLTMNIRCAKNAADYQMLCGRAPQGSFPVGYIWCYRVRNSNNLAWEYARTTGATALIIPSLFDAPFDDAWFHLMIVCDYAGKITYVYRQGILFYTSGTMVATPVFPSTDQIIYIGSGNGTNYYIKSGYLANVQLWTLATMPAAAQMLANAKRIMLGFNPIW